MLLKSPRLPSLTVRAPEEVGRKDWNAGVTARVKSFRLEKVAGRMETGVGAGDPLSTVTQLGGLLLPAQPWAKPMVIPPVVPTTLYVIVKS
jgi:hypothetical protein